MRILFVCLGNICRSPTAEAAVRAAAEAAGVAVEVASAGTGDWHVGHPPDERMTAAGRTVGLELTGSARQVRPRDLEQHDLVLAMDRSNLQALRALAPPAVRDRVRLFREFDPEVGGELDVPDPYYGGPEGFDHVVEICRRTAANLVRCIADGRV